MQSPIDIQTSVVIQDPQLLERPLSWTYVPNNCKSLMNTGHGWKVTVEGQNSSLTGGPLDHTYQLTQFHSHWGKCPNSGSEHTIDGRAFAGELHLVHWNVDLYNSPEEATSSPKGLAVLGIFFQVGKSNEELSKITDILSDVMCLEEACLLPTSVDPAAFIPESPEYWTYEGSLTTPEYNETVTWIVFKEPVEISQEQLDTFRTLHSSFPGDFIDEKAPIRSRVLENCRSAQSLNGRVIRETPY